MPSWPRRFCPQHHKVPLVFTAQVWPHAEETCDQLVPVPTWCGRCSGALRPMPTWPKLFRPQHHRVWSVFTPQVELPLVLIVAHPVPSTRLGVSLGVAVPSPIWPKSLRPQHFATPSERVRQVSWPPAERDTEAWATLRTTVPVWPVVTGAVPLVR